jgi:hypothetical protein
MPRAPVHLEWVHWPAPAFLLLLLLLLLLLHLKVDVLCAGGRAGARRDMMTTARRVCV